MKFQSKKLKKHSKVIIWKKFTISDFVLGFIAIVIAFIFSKFVFAYNQTQLIQFIVMVPLTLLQWVLLLSNNGVKLYVYLYRFLRFLVSKKKFTNKNNKKNDIDFLIPYGNIEKEYIWNKDKTIVFGALRVYGKDIALSSRENQQVFINSLTEFFNRISNKITIVKLPKKINLNKNIDAIKKNFTLDKNSEYHEQWLDEMIKKNKNNIEDSYYVIVYAKNISELSIEIDKLKNELFNCQIYNKKLNYLELVKLLNEIYIYDENFSFNSATDKILKIKNAKFKSKYFLLDDTYYSTQTIKEFPTLLKQNWVQDCFNSLSVVIWHLKAIDKSNLYKKLSKTETNAEFNLKNEKDRFESRKKRNEFEALENLANIAAYDNENILGSTLIFLNKSIDLKNLKDIQKLNKLNLQKWNAKIDDLTFRQFEGFANSLFREKDTLNEEQEQIASNISFAWPFIYESFNDNTFPITGLNKNNNSLVFFDPRIKTEQRTNNNMFILGEPGKGKTTFSKKIMLANYAKEDQIIIIDPQNEFVDFVEKLNGQIVDLGVGDNVKINPLQIRENFNPSLKTKTIKQKNIELLQAHESFIRQWFQILYPHFDKNDIIFIIKALHNIYKNYFFENIDVDISKLKNNEYPIIDELILEMKNLANNEKLESEKIKFKKIIDTLELDFVFGRYKNKFNSFSNLKLDNKIICFNVSSLMYQEKEVFNSMFYLIISYLQGKVSNRLNKTNKIWFFFDEVHKFIDEDNMSTLNFIYSTVKEGRKFNVGTVLTTQQPQDFLKSPKIEKMGQAIIASCQYGAIFGLKSESIKYVNNLFENIGGLTEFEKSQINIANIGEALIIISPIQRLLLKINYNDIEKELFFVKNQMISS
ncbi:Mbov_0397 family ICE element conjugal transfer ATPase [Mesomycoplasma neurolyticum]|uniref:Type IV secretory pathway, VirB4 components n=1 Tax=Mesomycoplasma neurolyticum TaxID=2120 RepID=A0A449A523_9BACT|nr:ATP-binding protein [Mesomycoplasma neurolyticum]VEU59338.1 Type IV secretory pathway, VirB4 components [Mesomycoplasma neurolyticum]